MSDKLPVVGAALRLATLPARAAWLVEDQRDVEIQDPCDPLFLERDWHAAAQEVRSLLDGHTGRLGVHAPFEGFGVCVPDPKIAQAMVERLLQALDFTGEIGGSHVVLHSPFLFFGSPQVVHRADERKVAIARMVDNLAPLVAAAAAQKCFLVFENICDLNPEPIDAAVRAFDSPWVRRSLDTGHANLMSRRGGPPADIWVRSSGDLLAHVHLADNDGEADRHWACGEGSVNWRSFFQEILKLDERPRLILEMSPERQDASVAWLRERGLAW